MLALVISVMAILLLPGCFALYNCSMVYKRIPESEDLKVNCGPTLIVVDVNLCTAQWAGFDPATLAMNGQHNNSLCSGTIDADVDPPIIRFQLPVNHSQENPCRESIQILEVGPRDGAVGQTYRAQALVVNSYINTPTSTEGTSSYSAELFYRFSCNYPLLYLLNSTPITASSVSVAASVNNGSFMSILSMSVYNDTSYCCPLIAPEAGLAPHTKVFVEVKASNLTGNLNVLLDHCFATPSPSSVLNGDQHSFFTGCQVDSETVVEKNGVGPSARFFFKAFRFTEHRERKKSSLYLHCIVRLCESSKCQMCSRRRRSQESFGLAAANSTTVSVGPIYTQNNDDTKQPSLLAYNVGGQAGENKMRSSDLMTGLLCGSGGTALLILGGRFVLKKFSRQENVFRVFS